MEQISIFFDGKELSVYFEVEHPPEEKFCSVCKKKQLTAGILINVREIIDARTQVPLEEDSSPWKDIQAAALEEYKHELKIVEAINLACERYPDYSNYKDTPTQEEISEILKKLKFVCTDCEDKAFEKKRRVLELFKKQEEVLYKPKYQL